MPFDLLEKVFGHVETQPSQQLAKRLEKLLRDIEKPRVTHPAKFWVAKEVQKATAPLVLTIPFEQKGQFTVVWAQNRQAYGVMLFAQSQYPSVDYDLWAYTRTKHRGHNIAKLTLAEGIRQLALERKDAVLTAEILIEDERTRRGAVRWLHVLGFIASEDQQETTYKRLFMAAYTKNTLSKSLLSLPTEFQEAKKKMPPMPPDILSKFTSHLTSSYDEGGHALLSRRRSTI
jgi:hypothetical protein